MTRTPKAMKGMMKKFSFSNIFRVLTVPERKSFANRIYPSPSILNKRKLETTDQDNQLMPQYANWIKQGFVTG